MRHRILIPALSAVCYAALGELYFRGDRTMRDAWGHCTEAPADYTPVALGMGAAVFMVSAALFARSLGARWKGPAALQAAVALLAGGMMGNVWYGYRMTHGSACAQTEFCTWCATSWWDRPAIAFILLALMGALLSLPMGLLSRRLRRTRSGSARDEVS